MTPPKYICKYVTESAMTSSGVFISVSRLRLSRMPAAVRTAPRIRMMAMAVCTACCVFFSSSAPR